MIRQGTPVVGVALVMVMITMVIIHSRTSKANL
jgi:hypothetical protein